MERRGKDRVVVRRTDGAPGASWLAARIAIADCQYSMPASFERKPRPKGSCRVPCGIVTWLILPVVICLSQRLSHACLSINTSTVKLRMAH